MELITSSQWLLRPPLLLLSSSSSPSPSSSSSFSSSVPRLRIRQALQASKQTALPSPSPSPSPLPSPSPSPPQQGADSNPKIPSNFHLGSSRASSSNRRWPPWISPNPKTGSGDDVKDVAENGGNRPSPLQKGANGDRGQPAAMETILRNLQKTDSFRRISISNSNRDRKNKEKMPLYSHFSDMLPKNKTLLPKEEGPEETERKKPRLPTLAELLIPREELKRLRKISAETPRNWLKIGKTAREITDDVVRAIHMKWKTSEVIKVKCHGGPLAQNMKNTLEELQKKTGGLVIWRAGSAAVIYRGKEYGRTTGHKTSLERSLENAISSKIDVFEMEAKHSVNEVANVENVNEMGRLENLDYSSSHEVDSTSFKRSEKPEAYVVFGTDKENDNSIKDMSNTFHSNIVNQSDMQNLDVRSSLSEVEGETSHSKFTFDNEVDSARFKLSEKPEAYAVFGTDRESDNSIKDMRNTFPLSNVNQSDMQNSNVKSSLSEVERETLHSKFTFDYEVEVQSLLQELGSHFEGWEFSKTFPVDGDLFPSVTPEYKPPLRPALYGMNSILSNEEMLRLRRRAKLLPPHFSLGRNTGHQGLAAAVLRLWEKSEFAKILMKTEIENISSEIMADELKRLTGGILLSRDKHFITFYRGKDFIPQAVADVLRRREAMAHLLEEEEKNRSEASIPVIQPLDTDTGKHDIQVNLEFQNADIGIQNQMDIEQHQQSKIITERKRRLQLLRQLEKSQALAMAKKEKAEEEMEKLLNLLNPLGESPDQESITEEERFMFQKLGMGMKPFLLVGKRGVFNGVIENMHLHWKYRELVKVIVKDREQGKVKAAARMLERESGGILVGIELTSKGHAIIVYRGKNYRRPLQLRPTNLLNKRQALKMSLESQRCEALARHISALEEELKLINKSMDTMHGSFTNPSIVQHTEDHEEYFEDIESANDSNGLWETSFAESDLEEEELVDSNSAEMADTNTLLKTRAEENVRAKLEAECDPTYRAAPLTNKERLRLRRQALQSRGPSHFHVGKSNLVGGVAKAIRLHFQKHALVKIGVKGRARGTSVQELVLELENSTGGVLVSNEGNKVILYRGWPDGDARPSGIFDEDLPTELIAAMKEEDSVWVERDILLQNNHPIKSL